MFKEMTETNCTENNNTNVNLIPVNKELHVLNGAPCFSHS